MNEFSLEQVTKQLNDIVMSGKKVYSTDIWDLFGFEHTAVEQPILVFEGGKYVVPIELEEELKRRLSHEF